jgi:hypothetical protein
MVDVGVDARPGERGHSRRSFLAYSGLALGAVAIPLAGKQLLGGAGDADAAPASRWSDPTTWGGQVPGPGSVATVTGQVTLDQDVTVGGVVIAPGAQLVFDPTKSVTLTTTGNVENQGTLTMRPSSAAFVHTILFSGVNEAAFVGGGMAVLGTDVGLWVMGNGVLDIAGTAKRAWTRSAKAVAKGATTISLAQPPTGWQVGDEVTLTPTLPPTARNHHDAYDTATITAISGSNVTLSKPCAFDHPVAMIGDGRGFACEVLNLSRNVRIGGTSSGRAHVFILSQQPQSIANAEIRWVAPNGKLGRYGLHFHMCAGGSVGSLVDSVVIRDAEFHAFVPHSSDGVTFRNCISHDTFSEAYWWDVAAAPNQVPNAPKTNNVTYDSCVASRVRSAGRIGVYRNTGYMLGAGTGSKIVNCVAVGVQGIVQSSGFLWGEMSVGVWDNTQLVSHNNQQDGIFTWQNNANNHVIADFVGYHNGGAGIEHGAYVNRYQYQRCVLYANGSTGVILHALSMDAKTGPQMRFSDILIDQAGLGTAAMIVTKHSLAATSPVILERVDARNYTMAGIYFHYTQSDTHPEVVDIVDWPFSGNEVYLASALDPASVIRLQDTAHGSLQIRPVGQSGTPRPAWNAAVTTIPAFTLASPAAPSTPTTTPSSSSSSTSTTTTTTSPSTTAPPTSSSTTSSTTTTTGAPSSTTSSTTTSSTTTTTAAPGAPQGGGGTSTFTFPAGSITVVADPTSVAFQSAAPNAGFKAVKRDMTPTSVWIDFAPATAGSGPTWRCWVQISNGQLTTRSYAA